MQEFLTRVAGMSKERLTLLALDLQERLEQNEFASSEPIAIVGMGCRLPGAPTLDAYWRLLSEGRDAISEIPRDRWDVDAYYSSDPDAPGKMYTRQGGFIERPDLFDAQFFGISSREAVALDPQQRLLLEVMWQALEHAHIPPTSLTESPTGVFVGTSTHDYMQFSSRYGSLDRMDAYGGTGTSPSVACGRISYTLGLHGPSFAVDTACSSSLVAVHLACSSLRRGECELAIAGGANIMAVPGPFVYFSKLRALAPDGRCKTFDASANGYGRGEGCGVVILKRLSDAVASHDRIVAIIRGTAVNHDGRSNGLTVPSGLAQEAVVRQALTQGRLLAEDVGYVEAHGTGTPLGDPIELHALGNVHRGRTTPLLVASVKTNIGHLEAAAGIAGLIKVALSLEQREIPPHLHLRRPNPYIDWSRLPIETPTARRPFPASATGRFVAGVSSFGFGGTNAHAVLEAAPLMNAPVREAERPTHLLCVSAKTEGALRSSAAALADHLTDVSEGEFGDVCFSANAGRAHFEHRLAVRADGPVECQRHLQQYLEGQASEQITTARVRPRDEPRVAFLFSGQGAQYAGMGKALFESEPRFRAAILRCEEILAGRLELPLTSLLWGAKAAADALLDRTENTQPALFALEYALGQLWLGWGVRPFIALGHSIGEYASACLAGIFSLEDALTLVAARGRLMRDRCETGAMLAAECDATTARAAIADALDRVAVAAVNGPRNTVIAGEHATIDLVAARLAAQGIKGRRLAVSHAFHSPLMTPMLAEFAGLAAQVHFDAPQWPLISNLTGRLGEAGEMSTPDYWVRQIREAVQFDQAVRTLAERGVTAMLEVGPKPVLLGMARQAQDIAGARWLPSLRPPANDWHQIADSLRQLYLAGLPIDWKTFDAPHHRRWTTLPTYPFERHRYWYDFPITESRTSVAAPAPPDTEENRGGDRPAPSVTDWLYRIQWEVQPAAVSRTSVAAPGRWLVFADERGAGRALTSALKEGGHDCVVVTPGEAFARIDPQRWSVRPGAAEDYKQLFEEMPPASLTGIVHAWSLDAQPSGDTADLLALQHRGYHSVLLTTQALVARADRTLPRLNILTSSAQHVTADDPTTGLAHSTIWGATPVAAIEHAPLRYSLIDLDPSSLSSLPEWRWAVATIAAAPRENLLARRQGKTYIARLVRTPKAASDTPALVRGDQAWVITGGTGGLGLLVAEWLVAHGVTKVALVARRPPSEQASHRIQQMTETGATVMVIGADVADRDACGTAVSTVRESLGPVHGIVHAAGAIDNAPFLQLDWERCRSLLVPKMQGTWNLHHATVADPVEHFVCFSSVSSVLGFPGHANYAAANAFLDAFAGYRRAHGAPCVSINWGPWAGSGMAAELTGEVRERWDALGVYGSLDADTALDAFGRLLNADAAQVAVMSTDWQRFFQVFPVGLEPPLLHTLAREFNRLQPPTPEWRGLIEKVRHAGPSERKELLAAYFERQLALVLGLSATTTFDRELGFFNLGMDSLMSVELRNRLQTAAGDSLVLPITIIFDRPNIAALVAYVEQELLDSGAPAVAVVSSPTTRDSIAIIGIGCRFPGHANDPDRFWQNLRDGVDAIQEIPPDRWNVDDFYDPDPDAPGKMTTRSGAFIDGIDRFDAQFFGISPREASRLDPQQRMLLETSWHALEHACQPATRLNNTPTGVFVGISVNDYLRLLSRNGDASQIDAYLGVGNALSMASGRIAHALGLQGPSLSVDTACSSSLVAVHLACESLHRGECDLALAGGVNAMLVPEVNVSLSKAHMLAPDGHCKTFDASADGYGRGEGCGMVVLKRLSDAERDGDDILAVIRGTAVNHDGRSSGLTVPNAVAQEALLERCLSAAGLEPRDIDYVEAHGTGTPLGDPIEVQSLGRVFKRGRTETRPLLIGAVKTNIGHLESAAGIASLIKTTLALRNNAIPASLHFRQPNPYIPWNELPVRVVTETQAWPQNGRVRRAGVSSFGFSGTNAHVIVEEAPSREARTSAPERPRHILTVCAKTNEALTELVERTAKTLEADGARIADICHTANAGRASLHRRVAVTGISGNELATRLRIAVREPIDVQGIRPSIAFVFSGQGSQYAGMGRELFQTEPHFRASILRCEELLAGQLELPLTALLFGDDTGRMKLLDRTDHTQPALFALEYALGQLWINWGIEPRFLLGHSVGEYAAACLAGVFTVEEGLTLIAARGRLMQTRCAPGAMAALSCGADIARDLLAVYETRADVAALNGPANTVVSGDHDAIAAIVEAAAARGIRTQLLDVSHAFHSPMMEPMLDAFRAVAERVRYSSPKWTLISNITGRPVDGAEVANADYWVRQVRQPVQFEASVRALLDGGADVFLEIGPRPVLLGMARQIGGGTANAWLPSLRPGSSDVEQMLESLRALYLAGAVVNWKAFDAPFAPSWTTIPPYPFQPHRFWPDAPSQPSPASPHGDTPAARESVVAAGHPLLGRALKSPALSGIVYEHGFSLSTPPYLNDHRIYSMMVVPGASHLSMVCSAMAEIDADAAVSITNVSFQEVLVVPDDELRSVQLVLRPQGTREFDFEVHSSADGTNWLLHASGRTAADESPGVHAPSSTPDINAVLTRCNEELGTARVWYQLMHRQGIQLGDQFQWVERVWRSDGEALGVVRAPREGDRAGDYIVHPGLLDSCFQLMGATLSTNELENSAYIPISIEELRLHRRPTRSMYVHVRLRPGAKDTKIADLVVFEQGGPIVANIVGLRIHRAPRTALLRFAQRRLRDALYSLTWVEQPALASSRDCRGREVLAFCSPGPLADALEKRLLAEGARVVFVRVGAGFDRLSDRAFAIDPVDAEQYDRVFRDALDGAEIWSDVLFLWSADHDASVDATRIEAAQQRGCLALMRLVQTLGRSRGGSPPRLTVATRNAQRVAGGTGAIDLTHSAIWGLARVIATEHPQVRCLRIDLDDVDREDANAALLVREIAGETPEDQVAFRQGNRYVCRLGRFSGGRSEQSPIASGEAYQLVRSPHGVIDELALHPAVRQQPGPGEVEILVEATALNFRDVLNALGLYPGDAGPLGGECAGTIVAVGAGVKDFAVGSRVLAIGAGTFNRFTVTDARMVKPVPGTMTSVDAATIPVAYVTAYYGLRHMAQIRRGDSVLIHAAAGGVGLAAIQLARFYGAEIHATAGSEEKRDLLHTMGVHHVYDSRSLAFAEGVRTATAGRGVDIVLNSLAGEFIDSSLGVTAANGRFIELGKTAIWTAERMASVRPDVAYHAMALDTVILQTPEFIGEMLGDIMAKISSGELPPLPHTVFPLAEVADAFRYMAQAKHVGKVLVTHVSAAGADLERPLVSSARTYLITGGLGALGLMLAHRLAEQGARHVTLIGRRAPKADAVRAIADIEALGATVRVELADVTDRAQLAVIAEKIRMSPAPLGGVFHAAGVTDDALLMRMDDDRFRRVLRPKLVGALHLHDLTRNDSLDHFVLFSSAAATLGTPGQSNYAAANAFLDGLAQHRRQNGLKALSVNWGPWAEAGMAADTSAEIRRQWATMGISSFTSKTGLALLEMLMREDVDQAVALNVEWDKLLRRFPIGMVPPLLTGLVEDRSRGAEASAEWLEFVKRIEDALPVERHAMLIERFRQQAARVLGLDSGARVDPHTPLNELGLDSLMAVELSNQLGAAAGVSLPATQLFDYPTIEKLAGFFLVKILKLEEEPVKRTAAPPAEESAAKIASSLLDSISDLSDEEVEAKLKSMGTIGSP